MHSQNAIAGVIVGVLGIALCGCSVQSHIVKPTTQVAAQIGVPLYPNAKIESAQESTQSVFGIRLHAVSMMLQTADDVDRAAQFYEQRLPKTARKTSLPLGPLKSVTFTYFSKADQKQVTLMTYHGQTVISLRATTFFSTVPSASPTPS